MDFSVFEARISGLERASIVLAPMRDIPRDDHISAFFPLELLRMRQKAHVQVGNIAADLAKGKAKELEVFNIRFTECLAIASFEMRHGFVESWPGFVLLFQKMFGADVVPWLPSLFLAALGQSKIPRPHFDLEEVLGFHARPAGLFNPPQFMVTQSLI